MPNYLVFFKHNQLLPNNNILINHESEEEACKYVAENGFGSDGENGTLHVTEITGVMATSRT